MDLTCKRSRAKGKEKQQRWNTFFSQSVYIHIFHIKWTSTLMPQKNRRRETDTEMERGYKGEQQAGKIASLAGIQTNLN